MDVITSRYMFSDAPFDIGPLHWGGATDIEWLILDTVVDLGNWPSHKRIAWNLHNHGKDR